MMDSPLEALAKRHRGSGRKCRDDALAVGVVHLVGSVVHEADGELVHA